MAATDSSENIRLMKENFLKCLGDASFRAQVVNKIYGDGACRALLVNKIRMEIKTMVPVIH